MQHGAREGAQSEILAAIAQEQAVHGSHWKQQGWQEEAVARVRGRKREGRGWEEGGGGATRKNARREKGERGKKERKKHKRQARENAERGNRRGTDAQAGEKGVERGGVLVLCGGGPSCIPCT